MKTSSGLSVLALDYSKCCINGDIFFPVHVLLSLTFHPREIFAIGSVVKFPNDFYFREFYVLKVVPRAGSHTSTPKNWCKC